MERALTLLELKLIVPLMEVVPVTVKLRETFSVPPVLMVSEEAV
jgi:hypothetical protein